MNPAKLKATRSVGAVATEQLFATPTKAALDRAAATPPKDMMPSRSKTPFQTPKRMIARRMSCGSYTAPASMAHPSKTTAQGAASIAGTLGVKSKFGATPLMIAAWNGNTKEMSQLLEEGGVYLDAMDTIGRTALMMAAGEGQVEAARLLLESGADVFRTDDFGESALSIAAREGRTATTELLLKHNADIDEPDQFGQTPLMKASQWGHDDVARLLLERGARHSLGDVYEETALMKAVKHGHPKVVRLLEDFGATGGVRGKANKLAATSSASQAMAPYRRRRTESTSQANEYVSKPLAAVHPQHGRMGRTRAPSCDRPTSSKTLQQLMADKERFEAQLQLRQQQIALREGSMGQRKPKGSNDPQTPSNLVTSMSSNTTPLRSRLAGSVNNDLAALCLSDSGESTSSNDLASHSTNDDIPPEIPQGMVKSAVCRCADVEDSTEKFEKFLSGLRMPVTGGDEAKMPLSSALEGANSQDGNGAPRYLDWLDEAVTLPEGKVAVVADLNSTLLAPSIGGPSATMANKANSFQSLDGLWTPGGVPDVSELDREPQADPKINDAGLCVMDEEMSRLRDLMEHVAHDRKELHKEREAIHSEREALQRERDALQRERQAMDMLHRRLAMWPWLPQGMPSPVPIHVPLAFNPRQPPPDYAETCYLQTDTPKSGEIK